MVILSVIKKRTSGLVMISIMLVLASLLLSCVETQAFIHTSPFHTPSRVAVSSLLHGDCSQHRTSSAVQLTVNAASDSGPAVLSPPETIEKKDTEKDKVTERNEKFDSGGWEIRLYNDPFNKREFVARCLTTICGKSDSESFQIMMQAHNDGMGVIGRYMFEIAELYYSSLQEEGLLVDMVHVEDE